MYSVSSLSRRQFVQGVAGGALLAAGRQLAWGAASAAADDPRSVLRGTEFHLEIGTREVNFTGKARSATVVNGQLPAPLLCWRQGDTVTIHVTNRLRAPTSIHWH